MSSLLPEKSSLILPSFFYTLSSFPDILCVMDAAQTRTESLFWMSPARLSIPPVTLQEVGSPHGCTNDVMKGKLYIAVTYNTKQPWHVRKRKGSIGTSLGKSMSHCCL